MFHHIGYALDFPSYIIWNQTEVLNKSSSAMYLTRLHSIHIDLSHIHSCQLFYIIILDVGQTFCIYI